MNTDTYNYSSYVFERELHANRCRAKALIAAMRLQVEYLERPSIGLPGTVVSSGDFDAAVLELADALRPESKVPELIIKIDGELSEDSAMKIQRALNKLHKRSGGMP